MLLWGHSVYDTRALYRRCSPHIWSSGRPTYGHVAGHLKMLLCRARALTRVLSARFGRGKCRCIAGVYLEQSYIYVSRANIRPKHGCCLLCRSCAHKTHNVWCIVCCIYSPIQCWWQSWQQYRPACTHLPNVVTNAHITYIHYIHIWQFTANLK